MRRILATLCLLFLSVTSSSGDNKQTDQDTNVASSSIQRLVDFLKTRNPHRVRPVKDFKKAVEVVFYIAPSRIVLDDEEQEMVVDAWSFMSWQDEYLSWTPSDYANQTSVSLWSTDVWLPDLTIYNRVEGSTTPLFVEVAVIVSHNGDVMWIPDTYFKVPCAMDLKRWPSDRHNCTVHVGSWAHDDTQIKVHNLPTEIGDISTSTEWRLVNHSSWVRLIEVTGAQHTDLRFSYVLQRLAGSKASYIVSSSFVVVISLLSSYFVPVTKLTPRILLHLFAMTVFIAGDIVLYFSLPNNGGKLPHVVRYYSGSLFLSTLSLITSLCLYEMTRRSPSLMDGVIKLAHSRKIVGTYSQLSNCDVEQPTSATSHRGTPNEIQLNVGGQTSQLATSSFQRESGTSDGPSEARSNPDGTTGGGSNTDGSDARRSITDGPTRIGTTEGPRGSSERPQESSERPQESPERPQEEGGCSNQASSSSESNPRLSLLEVSQQRRHRQIMVMVKVVNCIAFVLFAVAFLIDYIVLRSYV